MRSRKATGSAYVRQRQSVQQSNVDRRSDSKSMREALLDAIALELGDELDSRGISEAVFDDEACDRFAARIIDRFALVGIHKVE